MAAGELSNKGRGKEMIMKETGEVLDLALAAIEDLKAAKADGKIDLSDLIKMAVDLSPKVFPAVENVKAVVDEVKNATEEGVMELVAKLPVDGKVAKVVAGSLVVLKDLKAIYVSGKALVEAVKA